MAKIITLLEDGVRLSTSDRLRWRTGRATASFGEQDTLVIVWWSLMMGPDSKLQIPEERCAVSSWNITIHCEQDNLISYKYPCIRTKVTKYTHSHITQNQANSHLTSLAWLFPRNLTALKPRSSSLKARATTLSYNVVRIEDESFFYNSSSEGGGGGHLTVTHKIKHEL
jgi:hypothetical protein